MILTRTRLLNFFSDKHIQRWHISYSFKKKSSENEFTSSQVIPFIHSAAEDSYVLCFVITWCGSFAF